jgi:DNA polymerase III subunit epsilon
MLPRNFTYVDVETTGTSFRGDRVIEIGMIRVEDGKVVKKLESLINPQQHITQNIFNLTGISAKELENAPTFRELHKEIKEMLDDSIFVAHSAAFDYGFIKNEFKLLEQTFTSRYLCTVKLSRALFPEFSSHNLDSLIQRFNFECLARHRALADAQVLVDFVDLVHKSFPLERVEEVINRLLKRPSRPMGILDTVLDNLPETPGVYIFYGNTGIPLYIGKSNNIKNRVLSHFSSAPASTKEMEIAAQVMDIETIPTEGELGALLKEATLVKEMQPLYNIKLRSSQKLIYLGSDINASGYKQIIFNTKPHEEVLGVFKTQKQAKEVLFKISEEHNLCKKLLGVEQTSDSCFGYKLGKCAGACVNQENITKYNLKFDLAFIQTKIKRWPFNGPVLISEGDDNYVVENWCFTRIDKLATEIPQVNSSEFDIDTYKILSSYIYSNKNGKNIKVVSE